MGLRRNLPVNFLLALFFAVLGFCVMGYHPGAEDDGVYLAAVKADLNPALYPHDAAFFQLQMRTSVFDTWMARFVQGTGMSVAAAELLWQALSILLIVWACWSIVRYLFEEAAAQWAGVALLTAMLTIPVAGTALYIMDQYLHPRNPATALILFAVARILAGKRWQAVPLLVFAFILHPLMTVFGISFCCVLVLTLSDPFQAQLRALRAGMFRTAGAPVAALIPFTWIFAPPSRTWLLAMRSRHWFSIYQWEWYEWLGALAPLVLFWLVARIAAKRGETNLARFSTAVLVYGVFQQAAAMIMLGPPSLICLSTLEPMRYLQLVYVFLMLIGGAYLGRYVLKTRAWRWALFLLLTNGGMFVAQRQLFASTPHIELPSMVSANPWQQAFAWIRQNTPQNAYFALDPHYLALPGNDCHGFRALAERSQLADAIKDTSVITKVPELGPVWERQVEAQKGWPNFQIQDFKRLNTEFGVDWVLVSYPQPAGLLCRWHNESLAVCQIP
jgi:hypothetical protein